MPQCQVRVRPVVARIACTWARQWSELAAPTLFRPDKGDGFWSIFQEIESQRWKLYYARHRTRILERQKINYAKRKGRQPPATDP